MQVMAYFRGSDGCCAGASAKDVARLAARVLRVGDHSVPRPKAGGWRAFSLALKQVKETALEGAVREAKVAGLSCSARVIKAEYKT